MDKKLNEVTKVTDMAYVPVIMADGSIGQIAKSDLASVVAGMMNIIGNSFYTSIVSGSESMGNPKAIAEEVLDALPAKDITFSVIHQYSGLRVVSGYIYGGKQYGVLSIKEFGGSEITFFINGGVFQQRIDNFGYNSLGELAGGVANEMRLSIAPNSGVRAKYATDFDSNWFPSNHGFNVRFDDGRTNGVGFELFLTYSGEFYYKTEGSSTWKKVSTV